jgi:hypothetical protein
MTDFNERLHVINSNGGYCGKYDFRTATELAGECGCYAMDSDGLHVKFENGMWSRELMPEGIIEVVNNSSHD